MKKHKSYHIICDDFKDIKKCFDKLEDEIILVLYNSQKNKKEISNYITLINKNYLSVNIIF